MHPMTSQRAEPYVWVSWITKVLAGESSCVWSAWFRAHYQTAKKPNGLDLGSWQMEHNDMNDELAKAGAYNALKKKQITAWADLRNNAAHGNTTAYTAADVGTFLRDVSDFCANYS